MRAAPASGSPNGAAFFHSSSESKHGSNQCQRKLKRNRGMVVRELGQFRLCRELQEPPGQHHPIHARRTGRRGVAAVEKEIRVNRINPEQAVQALAGVERLDPSGRMTSDDLLPLASGGMCFEVVGGESRAVYVLKIGGGVAWVNAAKGAGKLDLCDLLSLVVEAQAAELDAVAFQTSRPGLVRKAKKLGYEVTGWVLKKRIKR